MPFLLRCRRHENDMLLHLKDMRDPICAILPKLIELAVLVIVQLHSQVFERHTISASSCFLFETKLPAFALSSGFCFFCFYVLVKCQHQAFVFCANEES